MYCRLVRVEKKCGFIRSQYRRITSFERSSQRSWTGLVSHHRRLMHEHYELYLKSQQPSAPASVSRLPEVNSLPTRLWQYAIYSVLELLHDLRPPMPDHIRAFWCIAHSMLALLLETVPRFRANWAYALGELTKYRLETESMDEQDSVICRDTARSWYRNALEQVPSSALYFNLGVLAWPDLLPQLSFFMCATICHDRSNQDCEKARRLLSPFLEFKGDCGRPLTVNAFATAIAVLHNRGHSIQYHKALRTINLALDAHIQYIDALKFRTTGASIALSLCAAVLGFGADDSLLFKSLLQYNSAHVEVSCSSVEALDLFLSPPQDHMVDSPLRVAAYACNLFCSVTAVVLSRCHDCNTLSFAYVILSFLSGISLSPTAFVFVADFVPWNILVRFANVLVQQEDLSPIDFEDGDLPGTINGGTSTLPEDILLRGVVWKSFLPVAFSDGGRDDEQMVCALSQDRLRAKRCLWYLAQIAQVKTPFTIIGQGADVLQLSQRLDYDPFDNRFLTSKSR